MTNKFFTLCLICFGLIVLPATLNAQQRLWSLTGLGGGFNNGGTLLSMDRDGGNLVKEYSFSASR